MLGLVLIEGARFLNLELSMHLAVLAALEVVHTFCVSCKPQAA